VRRDPRRPLLSRQQLRRWTPAFYLAASPLVAYILPIGFRCPHTVVPRKAPAESDRQSSGRLACEAMLLGGVSGTL